MKRPSLKKRGKPFEMVVRDVFHLFDPSATVQHGRWVVGTYGRRELDVTIEGTVGGVARKAIIECKDYNPKKTGPVGVEIVDALITKRRLVSADVALICSNAGFTAQALREAKGEGIGMISVMRAGDSRIRFQVQEEVYTRRIKVESINLRVHFPEEPSVDLSGVPSDGITFRGAPLISWACQRASLLIGSNPIVAGSFTVTHKLKEPMRFEVPSGSITVIQIDVSVRISGGWYAHRVTLDAKAGIYDWLRRRVRLTPGANQLFIKNIDIMNGGEAIDRPPDSDLGFSDDFMPGEMAVWPLSVSGLDSIEPIPPIDELVVHEDIALNNLRIRDLPPEAYTSSGSAASGLTVPSV